MTTVVKVEAGPTSPPRHQPQLPALQQHHQEYPILQPSTTHPDPNLPAAFSPRQQQQQHENLRVMSPREGPSLLRPSAEELGGLEEEDASNGGRGRSYRSRLLRLCASKMAALPGLVAMALGVALFVLPVVAATYSAREEKSKSARDRRIILLLVTIPLAVATILHECLVLASYRTSFKGRMTLSLKVTTLLCLSIGCAISGFFLLEIHIPSWGFPFSADSNSVIYMLKLTCALDFALVFFLIVELAVACIKSVKQSKKKRNLEMAQQ